MVHVSLALDTKELAKPSKLCIVATIMYKKILDNSYRMLIIGLHIMHKIEKGIYTRFLLYRLTTPFYWY